MRESGTETSCFQPPPSGLWAADCSSRTFQKAARWASFWTMAASLIRPVSKAWLSSLSMAESAAPGSPETSSIRTYQGGVESSGSRVSGMLRSTNAMPMRFISSKASTPPPVSALARASSSMAAAGASRPTMAVARLRMTGNSFRVAAVTTPRVPSAPMSSCFRS